MRIGFNKDWRNTMTLQEKHIYESNLLAFKLACIINAFEILSTIVYNSDRVGPLNMVAMLVLQIIILIAFILSFAKFNRDEKGKYIIMGCMLAGYLVVTIGSVHVPYLWAFGPGLLILVLLYSDTKFTNITAGCVVAINLLFVALYFAWSPDPGATRPLQKKLLHHRSPALRSAMIARMIWQPPRIFLTRFWKSAEAGTSKLSA